MSRRGENIRKRKDGRWEGRYKAPTGGAALRSVYGKSYREVKEKLRLAREAEHAVPKCELTLADVLERWQCANEMRLKGGSVTKYDCLIRAHILPSLGSVPLSQLDLARINAFISEKLRCGRLDGTGALSRSYVRSIALVISAAMSFAAAQGLCPPLSGSVAKPAPARCRPTVLTPDEQRCLESVTRGRAQPLAVGVMLSLYTGLRVGEVCALSWDDIDLEGHLLEVRHTLSRVTARDGTAKTQLILDTPKTPSSRRQIPLPSFLAETLSRLKAESKSEFVVSESPGFVSVRTYEARWHRLAASCGLSHVNYHALRHTFATRCIESGADAKSLSEMLGHAGVSVTLNTYVHSSLDIKRRQLERLASSL